MYSSMFLVSKFAGKAEDETRDPPAIDTRRHLGVDPDAYNVGDLSPRILGTLREASTAAEELIHRSIRDSATKAEELIQRNSAALKMAADMNMNFATSSKSKNKNKSTRAIASTTSKNSASTGILGCGSSVVDSICLEDDRGDAAALQQIKPNCSSDSDDAESLESLPASSNAQITIRSLSQALVVLQMDQSKLQQDNDNANQRIAQLELALAERDQLIASREGLLEEKARAVRRAEGLLQTAIEMHKGEIEAATTERDSTIASLREDLANKDKDLADKAKALSSKDKALQQAQDNLRAAIEHQEELEQELDKSIKKSKPWWQCR